MSDAMNASETGGRAQRGGRARKIILALAIWAVLALCARMALGALAAEPASPAFDQTWSRTDQPVKSGQVDRTWMWGEEANSPALTEAYADAPGGQRTVQYFDKSRMEDNGYRASAPWDVTNGLLVVELVTGRMQVGDDDFEQYAPGEANVAGDQDVEGVSYATLAGLLDAPALPDGAAITRRISVNGGVSDDPALASYGVTAAQRVSVPGIDHQVASPFWAFMNSSGTVYEGGAYIEAPIFLSAYYATGYPITEAYWAEVKVAGVYQDVLLQCFERRCLTYTPGNAPGWQVEAGNVGQHYYQWRYQEIDDEQPGPPDDGQPAPSPTATATEPGDGTAPPEPSASPTATEPGDEPAETPVDPYAYLGQWGGPVDEDAAFLEPSAVAVGPDGSIYVTEYDNFRVQKFSPRGELLTSWGDEQSLGVPEAVAVDRAGNVFVSVDYGPVLKFDANGGYLGQIGQPGDFLIPAGIAFDSLDNVYVADFGAGQILKFNPAGALVDRLASEGSGPAQLDTPLGIAIDDQDGIYVADAGNGRIQMYATDGTHLGGWVGTSNPLARPYGVVVSANDIVYVSDPGVDRIIAFETDGTFLGSVGGTGSAPGKLHGPQHLALDATGYLYVADMLNNRIQKFGPNGNFLDMWSDGRRGRLTTPTINMTFAPNGNLFIADHTYERIQVFGPGGTFLREMDRFNTDLNLEDHRDITIGPDGYLYVARSGLGSITKYSHDGAHVSSWSTGYPDASAVAVHQSGNIYVADADSNAIQVFDQAGTLIDSWGGPGAGDGQFDQPVDIAIYEDVVYVVDQENHRVQYFDLSGAYLGQWGGEGNGEGEFASPYGIAVYEGLVFISDALNHRVQVFDATGAYLDQFGSFGSGPGELNTPSRVAVHDGVVYVLDTYNNRVQYFSSPALLR